MAENVVSEFWGGIVAVVIAIIGIAALAVLVSKQANTAGVLTAGGGALSNLLQTALSPVSSGGGGLPGLPAVPAPFIRQN